MTTFFQLTDLGLTASPAALMQQWLSFMQEAFPGYTPQAGNLEYIQALIFASWASDVANQASQGANDLFRSYGKTLVGVQPLFGSAAAAVVTVTATKSLSQIGETSAGLSTGGPIGAIPVDPLAVNVTAGSTVTLVSGANTQDFSASAAVAGSVSIPVAPQTPNFAYPAGTAVTGAGGYTLPAGSLFLLDGLWGFQSGVDVTLPVGALTAQVTVFSVVPGTAPNDAGSVSVALNQALDWVAGVGLVTPATGGVDAESDDQYQRRLATALSLAAPRPITAPDYANFVLNFQPAVGTDQQEVGRSAAIDGYDPALPAGPGWSPMAGGTGTYLNEREVTVAVTDSGGIALNDDTLRAIRLWLEGFREVNFIVNVVSPSYTSIYVKCSVRRVGSSSPGDVKANIQATLMGLLSPTGWGSTGGLLSAWDNTPTVYYSVIEAAIQDTVGVQSIVPGTLKTGTAPSPSGTTDLLLPGPFPLPLSTVAQLPLSAFTVVN